MYTIEGFKALTLKSSYSSTISSQIFCKPHNVPDTHPHKPSDRTLLVINIPSYITKDSLQIALSKFGKIHEIFLHKNPTSSVIPESKFPFLNPDEPVKGYKVGYVVYKNADAIKRAMGHKLDISLIASTKDKPIISGLRKWYTEYNSKFVKVESLHKEAEAIMKDYDERKDREKQERSQEPDENGWITVSTKKRPAPVKENSKGSKRKRRKKADLTHFYSFQQKETNMKHLEERKRKFEEDGQRMMMMRKSRKFNPL